MLVVLLMTMSLMCVLLLSKLTPVSSFWMKPSSLSSLSSSTRCLARSSGAFSTMASTKRKKTKIEATTPGATTTTTTTTTATFQERDLPEETLFVIDGTSLIYRSYFSFKANDSVKDIKETTQLTKEIKEFMLTTPEFAPFFKPKRKPTTTETVGNASTSVWFESVEEEVDGAMLVSTVERFVGLLQRCGYPKYAVVVFDDVVAVEVEKKSFRHALFPQYKAQRPSRPLEMNVLFALLPRVLQLLGCRCFKQNGFEADDVMATIGKWAHTRGLNVVHVSPDKDMLQLIESGVHIYRPAKNQFVDVSVVADEFELAPKQLVDFLALTGDSADNIPGLKGVGDKTAKKLIQHFGSIEQLVDAVQKDTATTTTTTTTSSELEEQLTAALTGVKVSRPKLMIELRNNVPLLLLMKQLISLKSDVPLSEPFGFGFGFGNNNNNNNNNNNYLETLTTNHFRYVGERPEFVNIEESNNSNNVERKKEDVVAAALTNICPALIAPLQSLRYKYAKFDRDL